LLEIELRLVPSQTFEEAFKDLYSRNFVIADYMAQPGVRIKGGTGNADGGKTGGETDGRGAAGWNGGLREKLALPLLQEP
jgi:hypothetical protein